MFAQPAARVSISARTTFARCAQCEASGALTTSRSYSKLPARTAWRPKPVSIRQPASRRNASGAANKAWAFMKEQTRRSPILFPLGVVTLIGMTGFFAFYIPWYYENIIIKPFRKYSEPVARKLRRAMFYSRDNNLDIREASRYFREAMSVAASEGMSKFSDEGMAMRYLYALACENAKEYGAAASILEEMRVESEEWLAEEGDKHWHDGERARVLKNSIQVVVKLGQVYGCRYYRDVELAEKRLTWAVETMLREVQRREKEGLKDGEGQFMSDSEMGATLEALGTHYETYNKRTFALPLFLKALEYCEKDSCHSVILMNNISTCIAQQPLPPSPSSTTTTSSSPSTPPPTRTQQITQARLWAQKALDHADAIPWSNRDEECSTGCATATHNLGEFAEMEGKFSEARKLYDRAGRMAWRAGFKEGRVRAKEGAKRVKGRVEGEVVGV